MRYIVFEDESVVLFGNNTSFKSIAGNRPVHSAGQATLKFNPGRKMTSSARGCLEAEEEIGAYARIGDDAAIEEVVNTPKVEVREWM